MSIQDEKKAIIELINSTNERWKLRAIKELLSSDNSINNYDKAILDERLDMIAEGKAEYLKWDDVKTRLN